MGDLSLAEAIAAGGTSWGCRFVEALAAKDAAALESAFAAEADFRAMTPQRHWQARTGAEAVREVILGHWFGPDDRIESVERVETAMVGSRIRLGYRLGVSNPDGVFLVEQQAFADIVEGKITFLRLVCSGYVPAAAS